MHPEDQIYKAKTFINELQKVQETYFSSLVENLNLSKNGEEWLFDYIYNTSEDDGYDDFEHYLNDFKQKYENLISQKEVICKNSLDYIEAISVESCYSADDLTLQKFDSETSLSSFLDDKEQCCYELNTTNSTACSGDIIV